MRSWEWNGLNQLGKCPNAVRNEKDIKTALKKVNEWLKKHSLSLQFSQNLSPEIAN